MTALVFLLLKSQKQPILINAMSIRDIKPMSRGKGSFIIYDDESSQAVDDSISDIITALNGMNLLRKPSNE